MHIEKVIWEQSSIPVFPMIRRETYFTYRDLREMTDQSLPLPEGLVELDQLFNDYCEFVNCNKNTLIRLVRSSANPLDPAPLLPTNASFENPGYFIPDKFHRLLFKTWLHQQTEFVVDLCGRDSR
jgi:hypothetical protein